MNENTLVLKPIGDLLKESFFVPSYQRGYRWTKKEITDLLDDIYQFNRDAQNADPDVYYCLQPVVVTPNDNKWSVVDGQQRLTSVLLILIYLDDLMKIIGKNRYDLSYETRPHSQDFIKDIKNIDPIKKNENIDFYHIWNAFKSIEEWFEEKDGTIKFPLLQTIIGDIKNIKVIWYEVQNKEAIEIFTRINIGKIPLTNAELIKALFLRKSNYTNIPNEIIDLKQIEIATEWDIIENKLQNDKFWYFIYDNSKHYDTRIEFIFDLMKKKENSPDDFFTFLAFNTDFESGRSIDEIWLEIKQYFMRLEEWYSVSLFYHLVGFLVHTKEKVSKILEESKVMTKKEFEVYLKNKVRDKYKKTELKEIKYGDNKIKDILLLYNIETLLQNPKANVFFPFDEFKKENWDIEHISSRQSDAPSEKNRKKWIENIIDFFEGDTVLDHYEKGENNVGEIVSKAKQMIKDDDFKDLNFNPIYDKIIEYFKENESDRESFVDNISNLTLLDSFTNRSYKNAVFPVKRKRILQNDMQGVFVPICTKNVFLKYYSKKLHELMFWQKADADSYLKNIEETLKNYFN